MLHGGRIDSCSWRALASMATQIADEMDGLDVDVVECGISPAKDRVVAEVRREMMELGYHYDDLTDEVMEDMLSEFDFDGDEEKLIAEIVKEADNFVKADKQLQNDVAELSDELKSLGTYRKSSVAKTIEWCEYSLYILKRLHGQMEAEECESA